MDSYLLLVLGLVMLVAGILWLHKISRSSKLSHRAGSILISMMGLGFIWNSAAQNVPAYINPEMDVIKSGPTWIITSVGFDRARNCNITNAVATAKLNDNRIENLEVMYLQVSVTKTNRELGYLVITDMVNKPNIVDISISLHSDCPLGYKVTTKLDKLTLPEAFK